MTLVETKSGPIELVKQGPVMLLQFNCSCEDALPYCKAMCCRMRMAYNVEITEEEAARLKGMDAEKDGRKLKVLPVKDTVNWDCLYLTDESKCSVQNEKPSHCRNWHCSPKGNPNDESIKRRDVGFVVMPSAWSVKP